MQLPLENGRIGKVIVPFWEDECVHNCYEAKKTILLSDHLLSIDGFIELLPCQRTAVTSLAYGFKQVHIMPIACNLSVNPYKIHQHKYMHWQYLTRRM